MGGGKLAQQSLVKDRMNMTWWERRKLRKMNRQFANLYCQIVDDRDHVLSLFLGEYPRRVQEIHGFPCKTVTDRDYISMTDHEHMEIDECHLDDNGDPIIQTWKVVIVPTEPDILLHLFRDDMVRRHADGKYRH